MRVMSEITHLIDAAAAGDRQAAADLLPLIYDELRNSQPRGWRRRTRAPRLWCTCV